MEELSGSIDLAHLLWMINRWKIVFYNFFPAALSVRKNSKWFFISLEPFTTIRGVAKSKNQQRNALKVMSHHGIKLFVLIKLLLNSFHHEDMQTSWNMPTMAFQTITEIHSALLIFRANNRIALIDFRQ